MLRHAFDTQKLRAFGPVFLWQNSGGSGVNSPAKRRSLSSIAVEPDPQFRLSERDFSQLSVVPSKRMKPSRLGVSRNRKARHHSGSGLSVLAGCCPECNSSVESCSGFHRISGAAHGADNILHMRKIERLAQASDMHVDGALIHIDIVAPDAIQQLRAGEHPAG